jgi:hypothetical protein
MLKKLFLMVSAGLVCAACTPPELTDQEANFERVAPILSERCGIDGCHGDPANGNFMIPDGQEASIEDVRASLEDMETSTQSPLIVAGAPDESAIYQRLVAEPPELMPPNDPLNERDIELIRRWIEEGASYE